MELTAAIKTLEKLKTYKLKENFKLRTDSKYVIEGYTKWIINWKRNGWKTSSGKPVQNLDPVSYTHLTLPTNREV